MTIHKIPHANWITVLADAIEQCADGDTIIVHTNAMQELAQNARRRMCPDKAITFSLNASLARLEKLTTEKMELRAELTELQRENEQLKYDLQLARSLAATDGEC